MAGAFGRLDRRMQIFVIVAIAIAFGIAAIVHYRTEKKQVQQTVLAAGASDNLVLGNPSNATPEPSDRDNYLLLKPYFALSYNSTKGTPNWVSWRVIGADLGDAPRKLEFDFDLTLPPGFYAVHHQDYSGSGFDRGHMCPHSDRAADTTMSFATFVMTNVIPQAPNVNQKAWAQLEDYGRDLIRKEHDRLYIVAGPLGTGGTGSAGLRETIADGRVTVPAACWKIIVVVPDSGAPDDARSIGVDTRVITVLMPNDNTAVRDEWAGFRTSVAAIEQRTGYHFFDRLTPQVADALRARIDAAPIAPPRPKDYRSHHAPATEEPQ